MKLIMSILQNQFKLTQYELLVIWNTEEGLEGSGSKTFRIRTLKQWIAICTSRIE